MTARVYESPESASPRITRAVASALLNTPFDSFRFPGWQKLLLRVLNAGPVGMARAAARWEVGRSAHPPELAKRLRIEDLVAQRLHDYADLNKTFPVVVAGSALGGAAAHLAAALGGPFLPQPFVMNFKGGAVRDDVAVHFSNSRALGEAIIEANDEIVVIGHFDPVHDGWLTGVVNHVRVKLLRTPAAYRQFLRSRLQPGGAIVYLDCRATWPQFRVGERHVYQVGGWGGIDAETFLEGAPSIDAFLEARGSPHRGGWRLPDLKVERGPESEWGSEPELAEDLERFARREGFRFLRISMDEPHDFTRLTFHAYERLSASCGIEPQGVFIEMFTQYDPVSVLRSGLLPLWLVFNTGDSLAVLKDMRSHFPEGRPVFFSALVTLSRTPDMVPWDAWEDALEGLDWCSIGARPARYPEDLVALWRWQEPLKAWVRQHPAAYPAHLPVEDLEELADRLTRARPDTR